VPSPKCTSKVSNKVKLISENSILISSSEYNISAFAGPPE